MNPFDHLLFALLLVVPLIEWRWTWPRYLARLAAGVPGVRAAHYRALILGEWIPAVALLVFWSYRGRAFAALSLAAGPAIRLGLTFAGVLVLVALLFVQRSILLARPERIELLRKAIAHAEPILPHNLAERRLFWAVSLTAGVCEELFYRGFLVRYLSADLPIIAAIVLSSVIFGIGHIYLGPREVPKTAALGLVFSGMVWLAGSLWPAILLHAFIDWNSGEIGFRLLSNPDPGR